MKKIVLRLLLLSMVYVSLPSALAYAESSEYIGLDNNLGAYTPTSSLNGGEVIDLSNGNFLMQWQDAVVPGRSGMGLFFTRSLNAGNTETVIEAYLRAFSGAVNHYVGGTCYTSSGMIEPDCSAPYAGGSLTTTTYYQKKLDIPGLGSIEAKVNSLSDLSAENKILYSPETKGWDVSWANYRGVVVLTDVSPNKSEHSRHVFLVNAGGSLEAFNAKTGVSYSRGTGNVILQDLIDDADDEDANGWQDPMDVVKTLKILDGRGNEYSFEKNFSDKLRYKATYAHDCGPFYHRETCYDNYDLDGWRVDAYILKGYSDGNGTFITVDDPAPLIGSAQNVAIYLSGVKWQSIQRTIFEDREEWLAPGNRTWILKKDAEQRFVQVIDPEGGVTQIEYNPEIAFNNSQDSFPQVRKIGLDELRTPNSFVQIKNSTGGIIRYEFFDGYKSDTDSLKYIIVTEIPDVHDRNSFFQKYYRVYYAGGSSDAGTVRTVVDGVEGLQTDLSFTRKFGQLLLAKKTERGNLKEIVTNYTWDVNEEDKTVNGINTVNVTRDGYVYTNYTITYDVLGRPVAVLDPINDTTAYSYKIPADIVQDAIKPDSSLSSEERSNYLRQKDLVLSRSKQPSNVTMEYSSSDRCGNPVPLGKVTKVIRNSKTGEIKDYCYDLYGNIIGVFDGTQNSSVPDISIAYDANHLFVVDKISEGTKQTKYNYDPNTGNLLNITYPSGSVTEYQYDLLGRLEQIIIGKKAEGGGVAVISHEYLLNENSGGVSIIRTTIDEALSNKKYVIKKYYDSFGFLVKENRNGLLRSYFYDNTGRLISETGPGGKTSRFEYDGFGRIVGKYLPGLDDIRYTYGLEKIDNGNIQNTVDVSVGGSDVVYRKNTDLLGRLVSETKYNGGESLLTRYDYDSLNNIIDISSPSGLIINNEIDYNNNTLVRTYPGNDKISVNSIDPLGYIKGVTVSDSLNNSIDTSLTYDENHNLEQIHLSPTLGEDLNDVSMTHGMDGTNSEGRVKDIIDHYGTTSFWYGSTGAVEGVSRTISELDKKYQFYYDKDVFGNVLSLRYPNGLIIYYILDDQLRVKEIRKSAPNGLKIASLSYNSDGNVSSIIYPNGVYSYYDYDLAGRVVKIAAHKDGNYYLDERYTYDSRGRKTSVLHLDGSKVLYAYDNINRLIKAEYFKNGGDKSFDVQEYGYDNEGNRINYKDSVKNLRYEFEKDGDGKQISNKLKNIYTVKTDGTEDFVTSFSYELGAVVKQQEFSNGKVTFEKNYSYDADRRLIGVSVIDHLVGSDNKLSYEYDYSGRREKKIEDGASHYYIYGESLDPLVEVGDSGEVDLANIYIGSLRIAAIEGDRLKIFHSDELGNVLNVTNDEGVVTQTVRYDPFGNVNFLNGSDKNGYLFAGKQYDRVSGLVYFGARYYDPTLGRYLSMDPLAQGTNHYIYADNNPLIKKDIFGLWGISVGGMDGPSGDIGGVINIGGDGNVGTDSIGMPGMDGGGGNLSGNILIGSAINGFSSYFGVGGSTNFTGTMAGLALSMSSGMFADQKLSREAFEKECRSVTSLCVDLFENEWTEQHKNEPNEYSSDDNYNPDYSISIIPELVNYVPDYNLIPPVSDSLDTFEPVLSAASVIEVQSNPSLNILQGQSGIGLPVTGTSESNDWVPQLEFASKPSIVSDFQEEPDKPSSYVQEEHSTNNSTQAINNSGDPVLLHSGDLLQSDVDMKIPGRGMDFEFRRTYRSRILVNGHLGYNWDHNYNKRLVEQENGNIARFDGDARFDVYVKNQDGTYTTPPGKFDILSKLADGTFSIRDRHGIFYLYGTDGYITSITDSNNSTIVFNYETIGAEKRLSTLTDTLGKDVHFEYYADGALAGKLLKITDVVNRSVTFAYNDKLDLVSVTSPEQNSRYYTYSSGFEDDKADLNHNLISVADAKEQIYLFNVYSVFDRVVKQQFGSEGWFEFDYSQMAQNLECNKDEDVSEVLYRTKVKDRSGNVTVYDFNCQGNPLKKEEFTRTIRPSDPESYVTLYTYNLEGLVKSVIYPEGNQVGIKYQDTSASPANVAKWSGGNPVEISKIADQVRGGGSVVTSYEYEPLYNKPVKIVDPKSFATKIWYDYQEGLSLSQIAAYLGTTEQSVSALYSTIPLQQGDLNGNGFVEQLGGKVVRVDKPSATAYDGEVQQLVERFHYNNYGQLTKRVAATGAETTYSYNDGYLTGIAKDQAGLNVVTTLTRDSVGNVTSVVDPNGNSTSYKFNKLNKLTEKIDTLGNATKYTYDPNDDLVKIERENPGEWLTTEFEYNILSRPILKREEVKDGKVVVTEYKYDLNENLVRVIKPEGDSIFAQYDERDLPYLIVKGYNSEEASASAIYYDGNQNPVQMVNALGAATKYYYDGLDRRIMEEDALGNKTAYQYDPSGLVTDIKKWDLTTLLSQNDLIYDEAGRLIKHIESERETRYKYDSESRLIATVDPKGGVESYAHDPLGNLLSATDPAGNQKIYTYDKNGMVLTENDRAINSTSSYSYDPIGRVTEKADNLGNSWGYKYDGVGNLTEVTDPMANVIKFEFDGLGRLLKKVENPADPVVTQFGWDDDSRLVKLTDAKGNVTNYNYDSLGRKTSTTLADGSEYTAQYTKNSLVSSFSSPNGVKVDFSYDPLGRMIGRTISKNGGNLGKDEFGYDGLGRMLNSRSYEAGNILVDDNEFAYDTYGERISESSLGKNIVSSYDKNGARNAVLYPTSNSIGITVDDIGRPTAITDSIMGNISGISYAGLNQKSAVSYGNGTQGSFAYDSAARLESSVWQGAGGGIVDHLLSYNKNDNIVSDEFKHLGFKTNNYDYDSLSRLTGDSTNKYNYDKAFNFTSVVSNGIERNFAANNLNQYEGLVYDENGNIISDGNFNYEYNWRNQITTVYKASDNSLVARYQYDSFGRRAAKLNALAGEVTRYVYDGWQVAEEEGAGGELNASYIYNGLNEPAVMMRDGNAYYYHYDHQNSIEAITDQSGNIVERYSYDPFGKVTLTDGSGNSISESQIGNPYYYTGQTLDPETGLYNYRNRYYSPDLGRFVSRDPLGHITYSTSSLLREGVRGRGSFDSEMNLHAYVNNNPINKDDPYGLREDWETLQPEGWRPYSSETWNMSKPGSNTPGYYQYVEGVMVAGPAVALVSVGSAGVAVAVGPMVAATAMTVSSMAAYNGRLAIMSAQYEVNSAINYAMQYVNSVQSFVQSNASAIQSNGIVQYVYSHPEETSEFVTEAVGGFLEKFGEGSGLPPTNSYSGLAGWWFGISTGEFARTVSEVVFSDVNNKENIFGSNNEELHPKK